MKISYNWLKSYIPEVPSPEKIANAFIYHLCEVESLEKMPDGDVIFDIKILPNRAHDLLSHQGVARELASLLNIKFVDQTPLYKILKAQSTDLKIEIKSDACRRYMGRIVRNIKIGPSPKWVAERLESMGQKSINNMVDAANIVMFDCGQPTHVFDLDKVEEKLVIKEAKEGETITTLDNKDFKLRSSDLIIADKTHALAIAGIKGGKIAEIGNSTKNIILEVANFDPTSVRKTAQSLNIVTDAKKRFENDLSSELCSYAMREFSALILEMCPETIFEEIVDVYPQKQKEQKLAFSLDRISKILGMTVSIKEIEDILKRYNFQYKNSGEKFEIIVPPLRLDLMNEEDVAEEIGRILGYDKVKPEIPKTNFVPKQNEIYSKIKWARNKLFQDGYSEIMTYVFRDKGEVEVLASASDKKFLRTNLTDGLKESLKLNQLNALLLGMQDIKIFEIGTVFKKSVEEMHIAYGDKKGIKEMKLEEFVKVQGTQKNSSALLYPLAGTFRLHNFSLAENKFKMWSLFPFVVRDIAVWVPEDIKSVEVKKVIKENAGEMVIRGPELFDEFKKGDQISYAFRLVFQSFERTLTDTEVNEIMTKITNKIKEKNGWQAR